MESPIAATTLMSAGVSSLTVFGTMIHNHDDCLSDKLIINFVIIYYAIVYSLHAFILSVAQHCNCDII